MLITITRGGDILKCTEKQLPRYEGEGWVVVPEPETPPSRDIYHRDTTLVSMTKDGDIRLCTVNQVPRLKKLGWKEGTPNGEHEHESNLGGSREPEGNSSPAEERGPDLGTPGTDAGARGPEAGSHDESSEGSEDLTDLVREALLSLDPENDDHWTGLGLPRVNVVEKIVGVPELRKADLEKAIPGFKRPE